MLFPEGLYTRAHTRTETHIIYAFGGPVYDFRTSYNFAG